MFAVADLASTYATSTAESTVSLSDGSYVTISASDVTISLTPSNGDTTAYAKTTVTLESNSTNPVQLYLAMSGNTTALYKDGDTNASSRINATTTTGTLDGFTDNTWGYSLDNVNYQAVPDSSSAVQIASLDSSGTITQDIYYGIKVSSGFASGTYSNSVVYTATVGSEAIAPTATITNIKANGIDSDTMLVNRTNVITVTTNIKTDIHGEPRVYYEIADGSSNISRQECDAVQVGEDENGYLTITCTITPTTAVADGEATLYIVTKGSEDDYYCAEGLYSSDSSDCEAGNWKWGTFELTLPEIRVLFSGITTMQAMTTDICIAAQEGETTQLTDIRDNKTYWVAKLADGNCWMTQNLDFDLVGEDGSGSSVTLYSSTSNITSGNSTEFTAYFYTSATGGSNTNSLVQTWDLGDYVITNPTGSTSCGTYITDLSTCADGNGNDRFTSVSDSTTYDAHYHIGNYYNFNAATAGSGANTTSGEAANSICPAGWQLPLSNSTASGSFSYLLYAYGLLSSPSSSSGSVSSGNYNIASDPLYFVRGGYVYSSGLYDAGSYGLYWSRVALSSSIAYILYFDSSSVYPSYYIYFRYSGMSVRCVAV